MRILFLDTETTGGTEEDRLLQLAVKERGNPEPVVNALYMPPVPISLEAMAVHHITPKMLAGRPAFKDAPKYSSLKELLESPDTLVVAHNASFDLAMLAKEGIVPPVHACTYKVACALDAEGALGKYTLQYLRYAFDLELDVPAHDAWGDVVVLEGIFERLLSQMQQGNEGAALTEMVAISAQPLLFTTLRFGKHRGKKLAEVAKEDKGYLEWLLAQKRQNGEEDWVHTLEHYLKGT